MQLEVNTTVKSPGVFVVTPIGSIDGTDRGLLQGRLDAVLGQNPNTIIFDMERTDYLNSMGIRVLVKTKKALALRGGEIAFINLQPQIRKVFDIINALPAFKVFATIQEFDDYLRDELKKLE
jgi:anti-sigma B factor antagonist